MNKLLIGGIVSSVLGLLLYVVGIATTGWLSQSNGGVSVNAGLWVTCATQADLTICAAWDIGLLSGLFNATRSFALIGAILIFTGVAQACFAAKKNSNKAKKIGGGMIIAAGLCGILAAAIFTGENVNAVPGVSSLFGYSFYLTWVQVLFTVGGGAAIVAAGRRDEEA